MKPKPVEEGRRWMRQARCDLDDARFALDGRRFHLACFLAQQSAEKALNAFLYGKGSENVWGHSVAELCQDAVAVDAEFERVREKISPLDKYYIPTRYPNGLPGGIPSEAFDANDAGSAVGLAGAAIDFVAGRLPELEGK